MDVEPVFGGLSESSAVPDDANFVRQFRTAKHNDLVLQGAIMGMKMKYVTSLLAVGAAAVAIGAAPTALAANQQPCTATVCQTPGNVEIKTPAPQHQYHPYGTADQNGILFHH